MGYQTTRGLPVPFGSDGNNVPADLLAFAARLDAMLSPMLSSTIDALGGSDLWDGRLVYQADGANPLRPFVGFYAYRAPLGIWQSILPTAAATYTPLDTGGTGPIMGTGSENIGKWVRFGTHILGTFSIYTGSAAYTNGTWVVHLPVAPVDFNLSSPASGESVGAALFTDASATLAYIADITTIQAAGDPTTMVFNMETTTSAFTSTVPVTVAATDSMIGAFFYEAAEQTV